MRHGGNQGGRPKGSKSKNTITKEMAREQLRREVIANLGPMLQAQIANSKGIKYLVVRDKKGGKFLRVTEAMAKAKTGDTEELIEVWEKDPSIQAFSDLLNRALDKPMEQPQQIDLKVTGADILARLATGRTRLTHGERSKA